MGKPTTLYFRKLPTQLSLHHRWVVLLVALPRKDTAKLPLFNYRLEDSFPTFLLGGSAPFLMCLNIQGWNLEGFLFKQLVKEKGELTRRGDSLEHSGKCRF